jgi:hypothetical protein
MEGVNLDDALYFGLLYCIRQDILLRCGTCSFCERLVVHERQPREPLTRCFCRDADRDCKTDFHNARKPTTKAGRRPTKEERARSVNAGAGPAPHVVRSAPGLSALKAVAIAAGTHGSESGVGRLVKGLLGLNASQAWEFIDRVRKAAGSERELEKIWRQLTPLAQEGLIERHKHIPRL